VVDVCGRDVADVVATDGAVAGGARRRRSARLPRLDVARLHGQPASSAAHLRRRSVFDVTSFTESWSDTSSALGWRLRVVASVVRRMNEVTVHWARLVLGWVTVFGRVYHHGDITSQLG